MMLYLSVCFIAINITNAHRNYRVSSGIILPSFVVFEKKIRQRFKWIFEIQTEQRGSNSKATATHSFIQFTYIWSIFCSKSWNFLIESIKKQQPNIPSPNFRWWTRTFEAEWKKKTGWTTYFILAVITIDKFESFDQLHATDSSLPHLNYLEMHWQCSRAIVISCWLRTIQLLSVLRPALAV